MWKWLARTRIGNTQTTRASVSSAGVGCHVATNENHEAIRAAQTYLMGGANAPINVLLKADTVPDPISYLHSLASKGLGDSYNLYDKTVVMKVVLADTQRYPALEKVSCVMLQYRKGRV